MSKDKADAWMPFYVADYLGDTQRLTTEQHGAYLLLILDYWRNGPPPDDDAILAQITRLSVAAWKKHRAVLSRMFQVAAGEWRHKRIESELSDARAHAERRSRKAKAAAEARWGGAQRDANASPEDAISDAQAMPQAMLGACPIQSPSPSSLRSDIVDGGSARAEPPSDPLGPPGPPPDVIDVAKEAARIAGVRHVDPGRIIDHQAVVKGWLEDGLDPQSDIFPAIQSALLDAPSRISSLKYFDGPVRQWKARKEAQANGAKPRSQGRYADRMRDPVLDDIARGEPAGMA